MKEQLSVGMSGDLELNGSSSDEEGVRYYDVTEAWVILPE